MIAHNKSKEQNENLEYEEIHSLTQTHGIETKLDSNTSLSKVISTYHRECALFSTQKIIEKIEQFATEHHSIICIVDAMQFKRFENGKIAEIFEYTDPGQWED